MERKKPKPIIVEDELAVVPKEDAEATFDIQTWLAGLKPSTRRVYGPDVAAFLRWLWDKLSREADWPGYIPRKLVEAIDGRWVRAYLAERMGRPRRYCRTYRRKQKDGTFVEHVVERVTKGGISPTRHNVMLAILRSFARFLYETGYIDTDAYGRIKTIRSHRAEPEWTEPVPVEVMQAVVARTKPRNRIGITDRYYDELIALRDRTLFLLWWATAARKSEIASLKVEDFYKVEVEGRARHFVKYIGKGSRTYRKELPENIGRQIEFWLAKSTLGSHPTWPLFPSMNWAGTVKVEYREGGPPMARDLNTSLDEVLNKRFVQAGFKRRDGKSLYRTHGIRAGALCHYLEVRYLETGMMDLEGGRRLLGHVNLGTIERYAHYVFEKIEYGPPTMLALKSPDVDGVDLEEGI